MDKQDMSKILVDINGWLEDFCKQEWDKNDREWRYVRLSGLVPVENFTEIYDTDDMPEGTTHILKVGIEFISDGQTSIVLGQEFHVGKNDDGYVVLDDIADNFAGGPDLYDTTLDEARNWVLGIDPDIDTQSSVEIIEYPELTMGDVSKIMG